MNNLNYFNYIKPTKSIILRATDKIASTKDIARLNTYADTLKEITNFYTTNLDNNKIDYVYKEKDHIKILPVKYKKENFSHLTGINFAFASALEKFQFLQYGNNTYPIIIEKEDYTFNKLKIINRIPELLDSNINMLSNLKQIKQAERLDFSYGLKNNNSEFLLALKDFDPKFYTPKSLLNISHNDKYNKIPENTVLGIFREKEIKNGLYMETISLNKASLQNVEITTKMLLSMKKYTDDLVALRKQAHQQEFKKPTELPKPKSRTPSKKELAKQAFLRKRGLKRN